MVDLEDVLSLPKSTCCQNFLICSIYEQWHSQYFHIQVNTVIVMGILPDCPSRLPSVEFNREDDITDGLSFAV